MIKKGDGDLLFAEWNDHRGSYENRVWYRDLKVWDAHHQPLRAWIEAGKGHVAAIVVDDADAAYPVTIDPLASTVAWSKEANQDSAFYGQSVSSAGDVNGDGISDVIVGAPRYDNGNTNEGAVFVYLGSTSGLATSAALTLEGGHDNALFGSSVSCAGDVNGDGCFDIIVGAPGEDSAFIFHGGLSGLSSTPNRRLGGGLGTTPMFGSSVAGAGDVNHDGYSDVIVGAPEHDNGQTDEGAFFVYHGSSSGIAATPALSYEPNTAGVLLGTSVAGIGDINGDGYCDIAAGVPYYTSGQTYEGAALVFHGSGSGLAGSPSKTLEVNLASANFGSSLAGAGDVNGDGYADLIVGAPNYSTTAYWDGAAFVYHGSASGFSSTAVWSVNYESTGYKGGFSVASAGDANGDGYADVLISYPYWYGDRGYAALVLGSDSGLADAPEWSTVDLGNTLPSGSLCGYGAASAGDVNGDGLSDIIIGAREYGSGHTREGAAFVYHGASYGLGNAQSLSGQASSAFGTSAMPAGDVNGDGFADVVVGAPNYDNGETDEGAVYIYHGSDTGLASTPARTLEPDVAGARFGQSVCGAGDVNGDGYADIVVGAPRYANGETNEGAAFVYHGSAAGIPSAAAWNIEADMGEVLLGSSVSGAGDVNGDGYADVVIGASAYDQYGADYDYGRACVYLGSASGLLAVANWTVFGTKDGGRFGTSVSSAGDVNGDGYSDIIVSAPHFDSNGVDAGVVYVYHGSAAGVSDSPDWSLVGAAGKFLGISVSSAGDVNGDGFSDVAIGDSTGVAYVYFGSSSGVAGAVWSHAATGGGYAGGAGDVNGDGYDDLLAGSSSGTQVFYGSASGLPTEHDQLFAGAIGGDKAISCAGDVNGDGTSDVVLGNGNGATIYFGGSKGRRQNAQQYRSNQTTPVAPGGVTDAAGQLAMGLNAKSFLGRQDGKMVYEYKGNGQAFSGSPVSASVQSSGAQSSNTDLGLSGVMLKHTATGLTTGKTYKWRARVKYELPNAITGQVYGPWRSMPNERIHEGGIRMSSMAAPQVPTPTSPTDSAIGVFTDSKLDWADVAGATSYSLQVSTTSAFTANLVDQTGITASWYSPAGMENGTLYYWRVAAVNSQGASKWCTVQRFVSDLGAPRSIAPDSGATNVQEEPQFSWHTSTNAQRYDFEYGTDSKFASAIYSMWQVTDTVYQVPSYARLNSKTTYYWHTRAHNADGSDTSAWSPAWEFTTRPEYPTVPELVSPANYATLVSTTPLLTWKTSADADCYQIQVATDAVFSNVVATDSGGTDTSYQIGSALSHNANHYWRVRAFNVRGATSWASYYRFTTIPPPPNAPVPVSPTCGTSDVEVNPSLIWSTSSGATSYAVQVSVNPGFTSTVLSETGVTDTFFAASGLSNVTKYYWRVNASGTYGTGAWSSVDSFTTVVAAPDAPALATPADAAVDQATSLTLNWTVAARASTYRLQVSTASNFGTTVVDDSTLTAISEAVGPLSTSATYYWRVNAKNAGGTSAWSSTRSFTTVPPSPSVPTLALPASGAVDQALSPSLAWNAVSGAVSYRVQLSTADDFAVTVVDDSTLTTTARSVGPLSTATTYYWRVNAKNAGGTGAWSATWQFTTVPAAPGAPAPATPANSAADQSLNLSLAWSAATGATTYRVQLSTASNFGTTVVDDSALTGPSRGVGPLLTATTYYWRVNAKNAGGTSAWSTTRSFTTVPPAPPAPVPTSPANGAVDAPVSPILTWNSASGATSYQVQIAASPDFYTPIRDTSNLGDSCFTAPGLSNDETYYWRVRATNAGGASEWSATFSLTTVVALPSAVLLVAPLSGDTARTDSAALVWAKGTPKITRYCLDISTDSTFADAITDSAITDTTAMARALAGDTRYWWRVRACNAAGWGPYSVKRSFIVRLPQTRVLPGEFAFSMRGMSARGGLIQYALPKTEDVSIRLFDMRGRVAISIVNRQQPAGYYTVKVPVDAVSSGTFFLEFRSGAFMRRQLVRLFR